MDGRIERAIAAMKERLHTPLSIAELAGLAGLSSSRFGRLFRDATGTTPVAYLRELRMRRARTLLERTSLSIADVMAQVGVSDPSHFARDFRRAHGFGPRELRQILRAGAAGTKFFASNPCG
jgi:transcriptional regulator GlxA family with amidase domain